MADKSTPKKALDIEVAFSNFVKGAQSLDNTVKSEAVKDKHGFTLRDVTVGDKTYRLHITRDFHDRFQLWDKAEVNASSPAFKCEYPELEADAFNAGINFVNAVSSAPATEGLDANEFKKRRITIQNAIYAVVQKMDPSGDNTKRWKAILDGMTDKQFIEFMNHLKKGEVQLNIVMPNIKKVPKIQNLMEAAKMVGLELSHRLWLEDKTRPGKKFLTNEKYLVLEIPIRRAQQEWDKKLQVPSRDTHVDALTGQVILDDRACHLSLDEIHGLSSKRLDKTLDELVKIRGGDVIAYGEFKRQLEESGEASAASIDPRTRARSGVIAHVLLQSMMIDNNL